MTTRVLSAGESDILIIFWIFDISFCCCLFIAFQESLPRFMAQKSEVWSDTLLLHAPLLLGPATPRFPDNVRTPRSCAFISPIIHSPSPHHLTLLCSYKRQSLELNSIPGAHAPPTFSMSSPRPHRLYFSHYVGYEVHHMWLQKGETSRDPHPIG